MSPTRDSRAIQSLAGAREWTLIVALCAASVTACVLSIDFEILVDEPTVIRPALAYMRGEITTDVRYPSFPFYFYGAFFAVSGTLDSFEASLSVARVVNLGLFSANIVLFWMLLRRFFDQWWALFGTFVLVMTPGFFFSGVMVKTESLQLLELLLTLLCLERLRHDPGRLRWHALVGMLAALCMATKLNVLPLGLYVAALAHGRWIARQPLGFRPITTAAGAFAATLLLTWTNLWVFDEIVAFWKQDLYFAPGASVFRAVPGVLSVPYGRISSFFVTVLPILVGPFAALLIWPSLLGRWLPGWLSFVAGLGTAAYLALAVSVTPLRAAFSFSSALPFLVLCILETIRRGWVRLARSAPGRAAAWTALLGLSGLLVYNHSALTDIIYGFIRGAHGLIVRTGPDLALIANSAIDHSRTGGAERPIRDFLAARTPDRLVLFDPYLLNMCKYDDQPTYEDNCRLFHEMQNGTADYVIVKRWEIRFPFKALMLDPELRGLGYTLLHRRGGPASATEPPTR